MSKLDREGYGTLKMKSVAGAKYLKNVHMDIIFLPI